MVWELQMTRPPSSGDRCDCPTCEAIPDHAEARAHDHLRAVVRRLDERARRWVAAVEAVRRGHGGTRAVARITGLDEKTIRRGRHELAGGLGALDRRIRRVGGGRPAAEKKRRA
jgi:hypothetical protein